MTNSHKNIFSLISSWFNTGYKTEAVEDVVAPSKPDDLTPNIQNHFAIPGAFRYLFNPSPDISFKTGENIRKLMLNVSKTQWLQLYQSFKYTDVYQKDLVAIKNFPDDIAVELFGIASLNANGYLRQNALEELSIINSERKIPYLLLRTGDWVPQIRETAIKAVIECLRSGYAQKFINYIYILDWMTRIEKVNLKPLRHQIVNSIFSSADFQFVLKTLDNSDARIRRFAYQHLLYENNVDQTIISKGIKDKNYFIRKITFEYICSLSDDIKTGYIKQIINDHSPQLISSALLAIPENQWQNLYNDVHSKIFCDHSTVRYTARYLLEQHNTCITADNYKKELAAGKITIGTILGLAETGDKNDFDIILPYLNSNRSKICAAVLIGLFRLNNEKAIPHLIKSLESGNSKIRKVCVNLLCLYHNYDKEAVQKILNHHLPECRISALRVLSRDLSWQSLADIITLVNDNDSKVKNTAWDLFAQWHLYHCRTLGLEPSKDILAEIENSIKLLRSSNMTIPNFAVKSWNDLPLLIEHGKKLWRKV